MPCTKLTKIKNRVLSLLNWRVSVSAREIPVKTFFFPLKNLRYTVYKMKQKLKIWCSSWRILNPHIKLSNLIKTKTLLSNRSIYRTGNFLYLIRKSTAPLHACCLLGVPARKEKISVPAFYAQNNLGAMKLQIRIKVALKTKNKYINHFIY